MIHYYEIGLNNIFLLNGYKVIQTDNVRHDGRYVSVSNYEDLVTKVGLLICEQQHRMNAEQIIFLRKALNLSQNKLASLLMISSQSVGNYEKGRSFMPCPVETIFRLLFYNSLGRKPGVELINKTFLGVHDKTRNCFMYYNESNWQKTNEPKGRIKFDTES